ncbi:hypothetical protein AVEN_98388-1 [Araneus ventricosus]|uniref:Uncharacterized protein n=1 Tax=Araneus ventricosus TaxID=182803 RepID=A0A4Y2KM16_ARAVE|nr:hypothetical protein AVEN_98388-1 [Araneus ventricosus]
MACRIVDPVKCELRSVIRFLQAEGWFVGASVYCQTLRRLQGAILTSGVVLIHDNALPNNAVITQPLLEQFKREVSDHPALT